MSKNNKVFFDNNIEAIVLANFLFYYDKIGYLLDLLSDEDFHHHSARRIMSIMSELRNREIHVDGETVKGASQSTETRSKVDALIRMGPKNPSHTEDYVEILRKHRVFREADFCISKLSSELHTKDMNQDDVFTLFDEAATKVNNLGTIRGQKAVSTRAILEETYLRQKEFLNKKHSGVMGLSTGIPEIDEKISGCCGGDLIVVAARPSMGKTALALNIATHCSQNTEEGKSGKVAVFSLEMTASQLMDRVISSEASINMAGLRNHTLTNQEFEKLGAFKDSFNTDNLYISDNSCQDLVSICNTMRKLHREGKLIMGLVDYLQLVEIKGFKGNSRNDEVSKVTRAFKKLAQELNIPIIALSQLNRGVDSRPDKRPMMSDLRESGAIEQDADVIIFIYRDIVYNPKSDPHTADLIFSKIRNGSPGDVSLRFDGINVKFRKC